MTKIPEEKIEDEFDEKLLEEEVRSARALLQTFLQTLKAYRLYESSHPILAKFLDRLKKDFTSYFKEFDFFSLQVKEHHLLYRGKMVYESQDVRESLAFLFYKDGIREIRFYSGLEEKEVYDFLHIVRRGDHVNRSEDDLVTLFWERDFTHIEFTTVDEFLEGSGTLIPATAEDLSGKLEFFGRGEESGKEDRDPAESQPPPSLVAEGLRQVFSLTPGQSLVHACMLTPEEQGEIDRIAEMEQRPEYLFVLLDHLIEILLHLGEDIDAYENMISFFQRTIETLLDQGDVKQVIRVFNTLNEMMESMVLKDKQIFAIRRILQFVSSPEAVEHLGRRLRQNGAADADADSIQNYLQCLTKQAIDPLCLLLGQVESGKWRRTLCDRLADLSGADIDPLAKHLSDPNPMVVQQILYILGKIAHPSTPKHLSLLIHHDDLRVREETFRLAAKFGEKGRDLLQRFLRDPHPDLRGKASLALAKVARNQAVKPLMEVIQSEDFFKRDYGEKVSFFRALGETGAPEAVPFLEKMSKKRSWFQRSKWNEIRQCASMALKMMGTVSG